MIDMSPYKAVFIEEERGAMAKVRAAVDGLRSTPSDGHLLYETMRLFHSAGSACELMDLETIAADCRRIEKLCKGLVDDKKAATAGMMGDALGVAGALEGELKTMEREMAK